MEENKNGQNLPNGAPKSSSNNEDFLDKWIEQNLHMPPRDKTTATAGTSSAQASTGHKVVHPQAQNAHPAHKPAATHLPPKNGPQAAVKSPRNGPRPSRRPPFVKPNHRLSRPGLAVPAPVAAPAPRPAHQPANFVPTAQPRPQSHAPANAPTQAQKNEGKSFFSFFKREKGSEKSDNITVKPAHHTASTPIARGSFHGKMRLIPLGGLDEVGKNCMALEYGNDIIIIDMGFQFPEEDMLGVDYVIPDTTYLEDKVDRIRAILITHGHLDHIGAIPYIVPKLNFPPIYGTKLTMGLVDKRLEEFGLLGQSPSIVITAEDKLKLGAFEISFFRVNHSIPDAVGIVVKSPAGNIVHTGDFKFDFAPSGAQKPADFARIGGLAQEDIGALFIDSTNALKPGTTISEKKIGDSLEKIIKNIEGRLVIASFSSQIGRLQQIFDAAKKHDRKVFLSGRSLIDNIFIAQKLGYLKVPESIMFDIKKVAKIPEDKAIILTTGSQGEATSALTRMALEDHPSVKIKKGDTVVLSSSPIPGNERAVSTVTNNLCRLGAHIINNQIMDVHSSGHAQQDDLKLMMSLVKPRYVVPVHGEYFMRFGCKELAMSIGYEDKNAVIIENGDVLEMENNEIKATGEKVENKYILVDGLGVGDIGAQVMMDRQTLAENGVLIVIIPVDEKTQKLRGEIDIISRGFIYMKEAEALVQEIKGIADKAYRHIVEKRSDLKRGEAKKYVKESIDKFVHQKIERHPLVLPILIER